MARMGGWIASRAGVVRVEAFEGDPLSAATAFRKAGARRVHLVDLDLALEGRAGNLLAALGDRTD
jgi:phosphoribosylformimino-5-aminoimidazole carboxamide ribonucleotide (ProFAR) isomerase